MADRRKPFSFNTTLRNPTRMIQFLSVIAQYENQELTKEMILKIEADFIRYKIFKPTAGSLGTYRKEYKSEHGYFNSSDKSENADKRVNVLFRKWKKSKADNRCSNDEILYLLKNTITDHKERGFDYGWASRFYTQTVMLNEFGFTYLVPGERILISDNGKLLLSNKVISDNGDLKDSNSDIKVIDGSVDDIAFDNNSYSAYLIALAKYQTNNPWRHNTVKINFLKLVLQTIKYLDDKYGYKGINRKALSFIISWGNQDYKRLGDVINKFKVDFKETGFNIPNTLYRYVMNLFDSTTSDYASANQEFLELKSKDYKSEKILRETPDEVIRKLRLSELISLRGNGHHLDINTAESDKVSYVINNISNISSFPSDLKYFEYMGEINKELLFIDNYSDDEIQELDDIKQRTLKKLSNEFDWDLLENEFMIAGKSGVSKTLPFSDLPSYVSMEFLSAIITQKALPKSRVVPRYKIDDEGIAIQCASGANSKSSGEDINVYFQGTRMLLEPTIGTARSFQIDHEIPSIVNHYDAAIKDNNDNKKFDNIFSVFLASKVVKPDVGNQITYYNSIVGTNLYAWESKDYIEKSKHVTKLEDYQELKPYSKAKKLTNN